MCLREDINHPIGTIELKIETNMSSKENEMELGYWLGKPFWGNEYMKEAGKGLIEFGFNKLKLNAIWCGYYDGNYKSKRVQEKIGFVYHHTIDKVYLKNFNEYRKCHCYVITKKLYKQNI